MSNGIIVLVAGSTGERGQSGHRKVYEIIIDGNRVELRWGKAEQTKRQTKVEYFSNSNLAHLFATNKKWEKLDKGYTLAYSAF